jgi:hypothetical protein
MTDFRTLCAELVYELEEWVAFGDIGKIEFAHALIDRARAALAQPEPQGPTDDEILALSQEHEVSYTMSNGSVVYPMQEGSDMKDAVLSFARAVLDRWGNQ